ncbi:MAG: AMP-binding protein [Ilumatobacteraceae bacterium]
MEAHLATLYEAIADAVGDRPALIHGEAVRSWREVDERAARLAAAFGAAGLGVQSKVAFYLFNGPEYLEAELAALKARAVPVNELSVPRRRGRSPSSRTPMPKRWCSIPRWPIGSHGSRASCRR